MHYTDAPLAAPITIDAERKQCPRCGTSLPADAQKCDQCDWEQQGKSENAEGKASDLVAVALSAVPGLGHIYKGHKLIGIALMFFGTPIVLALCLLAATGTAGFGLLLLPVYWFAVMFHAYAIVDNVPPAQTDVGEQY